MHPLTTLVRSLGNDRALANVRTILEAQRREEWQVLGLARRLERTEAAMAPATADPSHATG